MVTRSRLILATALTAVALGGPPALAASGGTVDDARGEHAASLAGGTASSGGWSDPRSPDARDPFVRPVVVEVEQPASAGFDWTAAVIGLGAGLALAVLAGVGVAGTRRRPVRSSIG